MRADAQIGPQIIPLAAATLALLAAALLANAADTADGADDDSVISAREILPNVHNMWPNKQTDAREPARTEEMSAAVEAAKALGAGANLSALSAPDRRPADSGGEIDTSTATPLTLTPTTTTTTTTTNFQDSDADNADTAAPTETTGRQLPTGRLLIQLLLVSLLALVILSLVLVYSLKFCLCRRRRKPHWRHQRDLVADWALQQGYLGAQSGRQYQQQQQLQQHELLMAAAALNCTCPTTLAAPHPLDPTLLLRPTLPPACPCLTGSHAHAPAEPARPPAYSELFGLRAEGEREQEGADQLASDEQAALPALASQSGQRNLLVKLNLNKTKLLSAEDLVLLSKLIDVPIVVQQQQQQQLQSSQSDQLSPSTSASALSSTSPLRPANLRAANHSVAMRELEEQSADEKLASLSESHSSSRRTDT